MKKQQFPGLFVAFAAYNVGPLQRKRKVGVHITPKTLSWFMVLITIVNGVYKPTYTHLNGCDRPWRR